MNVKQKLGRRLAELRKEAGMTQFELSEKADYSVEFVSFVERGINSPSVEGCDRLARALKVRIRDLFEF